MKKVIFLLFLLLVPFWVHAEVKITDIDIEEKTPGLEVEEHPEFENLKMNLNLNFTEVDDFVKYKVTLKNDTKKDYAIDAEGELSNSEYIKYTLDYDKSEGTVIKAGKERVIYITASYIKEVPESAFTDGKYIEKKDTSITLVNDEKETNPGTAIGFVVLPAAVIMFISLTVILVNKRKLDRLSPFVIALAIAIPLAVLALEKLTITVSTNITIEYKTPEFCVIDVYENSETRNYQFLRGSTWDDYVSSSLNERYFKISDQYIFPFNGRTTYCDNHLHNSEETGDDVKTGDLIRPKENGCYILRAPVC